MTKLENNQFQCAECGGIFEKGRPDEEAMEEAIDNFGQETIEEQPLAVICDDCYNSYFN